MIYNASGVTCQLGNFCFECMTLHISRRSNSHCLRWEWKWEGMGIKLSGKWEWEWGVGMGMGWECRLNGVFTPSMTRTPLGIGWNGNNSSHSRTPLQYWRIRDAFHAAARDLQYATCLLHFELVILIKMLGCLRWCLAEVLFRPTLKKKSCPVMTAAYHSCINRPTMRDRGHRTPEVGILKCMQTMWQEPQPLLSAFEPWWFTPPWPVFYPHSLGECLPPQWPEHPWMSLCMQPS